MKIILDKLALFVSAIASPFLVIPFFSISIVSYLSENFVHFLIYCSILLVFSILLPFLFIIYEVKKGEIKDIHITIREQRTKPFLASILGTLISLMCFYGIKAPMEMIALTYVLLANGIVFALITQFWKISVHSAALAGSITLISVFINPDFAFLFLTLPLVAWARMRRHRHSFWQTLAAAIVTPLITLVLLKLIWHY